MCHLIIFPLPVKNIKSQRIYLSLAPLLLDLMKGSLRRLRETKKNGFLEEGISLRVAIIGAGPCGLACALELERRGIYPDIFERSSRVGFAVPKVGVMMQLFERPKRDQLHYLSDHFGLQIQPLAKLRKVVMRTYRRTVSFRGDLGYLVERGQSQEAVEVQLSKKLRSKIKFDTQADYRTLAGEYDYVVVAEGYPIAARDLSIYETTTSSWVKGTIVLGQFDPEAATIYYNTDYARYGYGYLAPFNRERAMLDLIVPDINRTDLSDYWNKFMDKEKFHPEIVETFEMHHVSGLSNRQRVDNILLVGNGGGFTDSFIGLGLFAGMAGGVLAGRAIAEGLDYERMVRPLIGQVRRLQAFREAFNKLDNTGIDLLVRAITLPGIKQAIYNTNIDFISLLHPLLKKYVTKPFPFLQRPAARK